MKGNAIIAEILQKDYGIKDLTGYEDIKYEMQHFTDEISRVKITSKSKQNFCCPVYALFDGYHMCWYGDYGSFVFDCTWKTNVMNLAYQSPYFMQIVKEKVGEETYIKWREEAEKEAEAYTIKDIMKTPYSRANYKEGVTSVDKLKS